MGEALMKSSVILQHIQEHWPSEVWMKLVNIYIPVEVNMFGIGNCLLLRVRGLQEYLFQIPKTSRSRFLLLYHDSKFITMSC